MNTQVFSPSFTQRLRAFPMAELQPTLRHLAAIESGPAKRAFEDLLAASGAAVGA